jgi:carbon monoxide dehydrogenase subunit G
MHLEGTHTLSAPPEQIWQLLMDTDVLARITPAISRLEPLGEDKYKAVAEVKLGPVKGSFDGEMELSDKKEPEHFTLHIRQNSRMGNVNAEGRIALQPADNAETKVAFSGDAKLSGTLARMGQRVIGGVANSMVRQFFQNLEEELAASQA